MKISTDNRPRSPLGLPAWVHSTIAAILTLAIAILDVSLPSFSILYFLPSLYVSLVIQGRAVWIQHACVAIAVLVAPALSEPNRVTAQGLFNRTLGIGMGLCFAYVIQTRRRFSGELQLANEQLENRVAARSAELESTIRQLRQSEERFRALVEYGFDGINILDANAQAIYSSPGNPALVGLATGEVDDDALGFVHPDDRPAIQQSFAQLLANPNKVFDLQMRLVRKDGSHFWAEAHARNLFDHPAVRGVVVNWRDVTERKKLEQSLLLTQFSIDHAADPIFWVAPNSEILYVNEAACKTLGYSREEMIGKTVPQIDPNFPASAWPAHWKELKERKTFSFESNQQTKSGKILHTEVTVNYLEFAGQELNCAIVRDTTERRMLEAQILHIQKLESLGVLAGGLAHDFNNLLTIMLGYAHMALAQLPQDSIASPMLREIELAAQRASDLTRQMLAYTGKGKTTIEPIRLDSLAQELAELLKSIISKKATLELDLNSATIWGDATQIRQVVMNLITNASDALEDDSGVIRVRTGIRTLDAKQLESQFTPERLPPGNYAFVDVEDNGCGMDEQTCSKIFDPFFSTKFTGRGLGLAAVLGIVRGHHGLIKVGSELGQGTLFEVLLPVSAEPVHPKAVFDSAPPLESPESRGLILVIEDDPKITDLATAILEHAGFSVCSAEDGVRGMEMFQQHRKRIIAILLDLTMPRMDGREFLEKLRPLAPQLPVVVMSGYSAQETSTRCAGMGESLFLQKPFEPRELIQRLCESLAPSEA